MGIYSSTAKILIQRADRFVRGGRVVTLGVHHFNHTEAELVEMFAGCGVRPDRSRPAVLNRRVHAPWLKPEALDAATLFHALGLGRVDELDVSRYEGASIVHDLNQPVPPELTGQFDLVFDGGTIEHVFDIKEALFNVVRLLRPGGTAVHAMPMSGWINHGFYQVSPTLLYDFYRANQFTSLSAGVLEINRVAGAKVYHWTLDDPYTEQLLFNDFRCKTLLVFFATKVAEHPLRVPLQGAYARLHAAPSDRARVANTAAPPRYIARAEPRISALASRSAVVSAIARIVPRPWFERLHAHFLEGRFTRATVPRTFEEI